MWVEALDGGDWKIDAPARDKLMRSQLPVNGPPEHIMTMRHRFKKLVNIEDSDLALLDVIDMTMRWRYRYIVDLRCPNQWARLLFDHSMDELFNFSLLRS